jgi:hypothetical protein
MSPYRRPGYEVAAEAPRDAGLVSDLITQFADPLAFYRELVQNSLDANTPTIEVEIDYEADERLARISVRDRGEGMTRDVLENRLLVLFRSTKEGVEGKIGKFGVGFVSVLAVEPRVVAITTACDGRRLGVHLHPDLSYELFDLGRATATGTTVELQVPLPLQRLDRFVRDSQAALERWCRHAPLPISFRARGPDGAVLAEARIDRPLGLEDALIEVRATSTDGHATCVVGVTALARPYGGFFNRGLTLHETDDPLLGRLAFKVQDPRLQHTLSRDDVRRDRNFARAIAFARAVAADRLPPAAARALANAAEDDRDRHADLFDALVAAEVKLARHQWVFPLLEPVEGRRAAGADLLAEHRPWGGSRRSPVTAELARAGVPVLDLSPPRGRSHGWLEAHVERRTGHHPRATAYALTLVSPVELAPTDRLLLDELAALLAAAYRKPAGVYLAEIDGALDGELFVAGGPRHAAIRARRGPGDPWVLARDERHDPFRLLRRAPLVLSARHPLIKAARERARTDSDLAASLLARILLVRAEALTEGRSETICARTVSRLVGGGGG